VTSAEAARRLMAFQLLRRVAASWNGGRLYLTGGSLRDRLLGVSTHDIDLVAEGGDPAAAAAALSRTFHGRAFPLGRPPEVTWRVVAPPLQFDVVGVEADLETDILRRDFSVNALFWRLPRGPLVDLVGGLDDLAAGRIRVVRARNLRSDPLRVLRAFRLVATRPSLRLTAECESQLATAAPRLRTVARERIADELRRLLAGGAVGRALVGAARCRALSPILPGWEHADRARLAAYLAARLSLQAAGRGALARAAGEVTPAVLAAPAAGLPERWDERAATVALDGAGWPLRAARRAVAAAGYGERMAALLGRDVPSSRGLAAEAGSLVEPALAWAVARDEHLADARAQSLLRWHRRFAAAPPLLSGEEIAQLCRLPAGPARSEAVQALRVAQARGEVRTRQGALRWLLAWS
jgi:tRNA nucleotidyltransferase (CCA-adding enzyme)